MKELEVAQVNSAPVRTVLLVEDDLALCDYLASALEAAGYVVLKAHYRSQAVSLLHAHCSCNLMLLDLGLPPQPSTMTEGLALLAEALRLVPTLKIMVLTGQDEDSAALEAVRRGAFDFLVKPASLAQIISALRRAEMFARQEARLVLGGEARLHLTARLDEGPKEAAAIAEEQLLRKVLTSTSYNVAEAARQLGLAREHVYYYLNKYGIRRPE
jgi:two-component system, response regulator RegA